MRCLIKTQNESKQPDNNGSIHLGYKYHGYFMLNGTQTNYGANWHFNDMFSHNKPAVLAATS